MISNFLNRIFSTGRLVVSALTVKRETAPLDSAAALQRFVSARAAFVTQKKLYGYLKTRMGTSWPKVFADDQFKESINIAAAQIFAASLSDLTIHAVSVSLKDSGLPARRKEQLARETFAFGIAENEEVNVAFKLESAAARAVFDKRLEGTDWDFGATLAENFKLSPAALLKWAPISDQLKQYDSEIVENSMKFAWIEVRREFAARLDADAVVRDLQDRGAAS